ncbi:MAG: class I SAM-dependent methyltransferase [Treponema sp.]|nr:class I SAM-dependent methyltransferase [Treponema sp.]
MTENNYSKPYSTPFINEEKRVIPCALCKGTVFKPSIDCLSFSYVYCIKCSLVQINPQPIADDVRKRYGENWGSDYLAYELANEENFFNLSQLALKDINFNEVEEDFKKSGTMRILDIGCATGALLASFRERGWECTGVEISGPQAEYTRQKKKLDIRSLPLEENNFPSASFEVITASHVIEHLNDPASFFKEVYRILVQGGTFIVITPNIAGFQAKLFGRKWRSAIFDHLYLFSVKTLSAFLREAGFTIEKIGTWGGLAIGTAPLPIKRIFDRGAKRFGFGDVMVMRVKK